MVSYFIAKHLAKEPGSVSGTCVLCGTQTETGNRKQDIISSSFTDHAMRKYDGAVVCPDCAACLSKTAFEGKALRSYSVIITETEIRKASRADIAAVIASPPDSDYILLVNYSMKKHAWFNAEINSQDADEIIVGTDQSKVRINRAQFADAYSIAMELYAGGFSKADIDGENTPKYSKIEDYGIDKYYSDMARLNPIRNTGAMQLLLWALNKTEQEVTND